MFKCYETYCIPSRMLCDDNPDCPDAEDEQHCDTFHCTGLLRCRGDDVCVHLNNICDGIVHCPYSGDDEKLCHMTICPDACVCRGSTVKCIQLGSILALPQKLSAVILEHYVLKSGSTLRHFTNVLHLVMRFCSFLANMIDEGTFSKISNVRRLNLTHNNLQFIKPKSFGYMYKVMMLDLRYNKIHQIKSHNFLGLQSLHYLSLRNFQIFGFEISPFYGLAEIRHLDLSFNRFTHIRRDMFIDLIAIRIIDLRNNNFLSIDFINIAGLSRNVSVYFDDMIYCCSLKHTHTCYINNTTDHQQNCNLQQTPFLLDVTNIVMSFGFLLVNVWTIYIGRHSGTSRHLVLLKHLSVANLPLCLYLILMSSLTSIYKDKFIYMSTLWMQSYWCRFLSVNFFTAFVASKMIMLLLVIDQLIAVKYMFNEHIISYFKYYLYGIWIGVILAAISFASVIPNHSITCSPLVISKHHSFVKLLLVGIVLFCTAVSVAVIPVIYAMIKAHVTASNKRVRNSKSTFNKRSIICKGTFITTIGTSTWLLMCLLSAYSYVNSDLQFNIPVQISISIHLYESINTIFLLKHSKIFEKFKLKILISIQN